MIDCAEESDECSFPSPEPPPSDPPPKEEPLPNEEPPNEDPAPGLGSSFGVEEAFGNPAPGLSALGADEGVAEALGNPADAGLSVLGAAEGVAAALGKPEDTGLSALGASALGSSDVLKGEGEDALGASGIIDLTGSAFFSAGAAFASSLPGMMDFLGSAVVNFVGVPPNLNVVSELSLGSPGFVSVSGSFREDWGMIDLFSSSFSSAAAFAAAATAGLVPAGLCAVASAGFEETV